MNRTTQPSSKSPLDVRLRREAMNERPGFDAALHERIMAAVGRGSRVTNAQDDMVATAGPWRRFALAATLLFCVAATVTILATVTRRIPTTPPVVQTDAWQFDGMAMINWLGKMTDTDAVLQEHASAAVSHWDHMTDQASFVSDLLDEYAVPLATARDE